MKERRNKGPGTDSNQGHVVHGLTPKPRGATQIIFLQGLKRKEKAAVLQEYNFMCH